MSRDTIKEWRKVEGFPGGRDGPTVLLDLALWIFRRDGLAIDPGEAPDKKTRKEDAELRKLEAVAAIQEAKARKVVGALVDREAAIARVSQLLAQVRTRLQAIPQELASSLPPDLRQDVTADIDGKIRLILTEMASWGRSEGLSVPAKGSESPISGKARPKPTTSKVAAKRSSRPKSRTRSRGPAKTS